MQTQPQKIPSIRFGSGVLKIDGVNVGLLDNGKMAIEFATLRLKAHNGQLPVKKKIESVKFTAELYEIHLPNISAIDTHGILTASAGSPVNVTAEALGTGWTVGTPIKISNKNGAGTIVTSVVVDEDGSPLTLNTDYRLYVADGTNGESGYTYIVPLTAQTGVLDVDYTYTPHVSKTITFSDVTKLVGYYEVVFENTDENGKVLRLTIPKGYSGGTMEFGFVADDAIDETMKVPFELDAYPDENNVMLIIYDEQSVV